MKRREVGRKGERKWGGGVREESERRGRRKRGKRKQMHLDNNVLPSSANVSRFEDTFTVASLGNMNAFVAIRMLLGLLTSENCTCQPPEP